MADENKTGGDFGGPWLIIFVIVALAVLFQAGAGSGGMFGGRGGIRTGSPSPTGTVEEELRGKRSSRTELRTGGRAISPPAARPPFVRKNIVLSRGNVYATDPEQEYISFYYALTAAGPITLNNWSVENSRGERAFILWGSPLVIEPGARVQLFSGWGSFALSGNRVQIYLRQEEELWKSSGETVLLRDARGIIVDKISY